MDYLQRQRSSPKHFRSQEAAPAVSKNASFVSEATKVGGYRRRQEGHLTTLFHLLVSNYKCCGKLTRGNSFSPTDWRDVKYAYMNVNAFRCNLTSSSSLTANVKSILEKSNSIQFGIQIHNTSNKFNFCRKWIMRTTLHTGLYWFTGITGCSK